MTWKSNYSIASSGKFAYIKLRLYTIETDGGVSSGDVDSMYDFIGKIFQHWFASHCFRYSCKK